jgi:hypothetical protein
MSSLNTAYLTVLVSYLVFKDTIKLIQAISYNYSRAKLTQMTDSREEIKPKYLDNY